MIKHPQPGLSQVEYLKAKERDRLSIWLIAGGTHRVAFVNSSLMIREMAANHGTGPTETLLLGQAYTAAVLMTSSLKGEDRINFRIDSDGPARGFTVDANAYGEVRGYLFANPITPPDNFSGNPAELFGKGMLTVTRYFENRRAPFSGVVDLVFGSVAQDLSNYYALSEQVPTAFNLGLDFEEGGTFKAGAGLLVQALPGADPKVTAELFEQMTHIPNCGRALAEVGDMNQLIEFWFGLWDPKPLDSRRVEFMCHCSQKRFSDFLGGLPEHEQTDILKNGPFPLITTCHNCNTGYEFTRDQLAALFGKK